MNGAERIAEERHRQRAIGYTPDHDAEHANGSLIEAAICYAAEAGTGWRAVSRSWPWSPNDWKPSPDPIRNLERAGALIAAEIDRLAALADRERA